MADIPSQARGSRQPTADRRSSSTSSRATRRPRASASTSSSQPLGHRDGRAGRRARTACWPTTSFADVDVPGFDRSNVDGFAVQASDTFGAMEEDAAHACALNDEVLAPGRRARASGRRPGVATPIATGGMLPRGADAVVMVEHTEVVVDRPTARGRDRRARSRRARTSATPAPTSRAARPCCAPDRCSTSREIGVLAAIGIARGRGLPPAARGDLLDRRRDRRARQAAARRARSTTPTPRSSAPPSRSSAASRCSSASCPTTKRRSPSALARGARSRPRALLGRHVQGRRRPLVPRREPARAIPGIVAHGVALKPGKPICLAVTDGKPVVILPGFPTSAIFTFHEFVAPVIRAFAGLPAERRQSGRPRRCRCA